MDIAGSTRASAKVGLKIIVLTSEWPDHDVQISFAQALDIVDWRDTRPAQYRAALGGRWTPTVTSAFKRLAGQGAITGTIDEAAKTLTAAISAELRVKLGERTAEGVTRVDAIRAALLVAKGQHPDAAGPFVDLAGEIGFEP